MFIVHVLGRTGECLQLKLGLLHFLQAFVDAEQLEHLIAEVCIGTHIYADVCGCIKNNKKIAYIY